MISGTAVTVLRPVYGKADRLGNRTVDRWESESVNNVLVAPGPTADLDAGRPDGVEVAFTLHFPKGYDDSLEGCMVALPAPWSGTYPVVGDPRPYMDANTPTPWHMPVEVGRAHG